jgi:hypothetical protein
MQGIPSWGHTYNYRSKGFLEICKCVIQECIMQPFDKHHSPLFSAAVAFIK